MTEEERYHSIALLLAGGMLLVGLILGGLLVKQDLKGLQYQYDQLEGQYNQLTDMHWNLQQDYLKLKEQQTKGFE